LISSEKFAIGKECYATGYSRFRTQTLRMWEIGYRTSPRFLRQANAPKGLIGYMRLPGKIDMRTRKGNFHNIYEEFADNIRIGLSQNFGAKTISPKFFYDDSGSRLFDKICRQPEYYPTRTEIEILEKYSKEIISGLNCNAASMIEFGSGSSLKTRIILKHFFSYGVNVMYFPVDISHTALGSSVRKLTSEFKNLSIIGVSSEYLEGIRRICNLIEANNQMPQKKVMFFLGSSIGNFEPDATKSFLKSIKRSMRTDTQDNLFISFDLEKDIDKLQAAYNDRAGITSRFNLNLLKRVNKDLGGTFNLRNFFHSATYNKKRKRVEMFIVSKYDQEVYIRDLNQTIILKKNEKIHTENSYKYSLNQIEQLAEESGFVVMRNYVDTNRWFALVSLSPR
jgi:L-histidine Nalpha-methyltransferase